MSGPSVKAKAAYFAANRRSNYVASLRLEGFEVRPSDAKQEPPSKALIIHKYKVRA